MRIDCDACGAAYAIDDTLVTPRGVRAQCPKCAHQKIVKSPPVARAETPFGSATPFASSEPSGAMPSSPPTPFGAPAAPPSSPFNAPSSPFNAPSPFGAPPSPFSGNPQPQIPTPSPAPSPFGGGPSPFAQPQAPSIADPFSAPQSGANPFAAPAPPENPFAQQGAPAVNPFEAQPADPFAQQVEAVDPFDAIGLSHEPGVEPSGDQISLDSGASFEDIMASAPEPQFPSSNDVTRESLWRTKSKAGLEENLTFNEIVERARAGKLKGTDLVSEMGGSWTRADRSPFASSFGLAGESRGIRSRAPMGGLTKIAIVLGLIALVIGGLYIARPNLFSFAKKISNTPFARAETQWRMEFPQAEGSAKEQVKKAQTLARVDTADGYKRADEHFRIALLTDSRDTDAIAGYVKNFAHLPNAKANASGTALALDGVNWALKKEPDNAKLLAAKAQLRLMMDDIASVEDARELIQQAALQKSDDAEIQLILAQSHLQRNPQKSVGLVEGALASAPDLTAALTVLGGAHRRLGNYKKARGALNDRLARDPNNRDALKELAQLELDVGNKSAAAKHLATLLAAQPRDISARLMQAKMRYQLEGNPSLAAKELEETIANYQKDAGDLLLALETHLGFVKGMLLGDTEAGIALVEAAKKRDSSYQPALFVLGQLYQKLGKRDESIDNFARAESAMRDSLLGPNAAARLGDAQVLAGQRSEGLRQLNKAIQNSPRDINTYFMLARAHLLKGETSSAFTIMRKALDVNPDRSFETKALTDYPEAPAFLDGLAKSIAETKVTKNEKPLSLLAQGMVRYHKGDIRKAENLFQTVLRLDKNNPGALLYAGAAALKQNKRAASLKHLKRAEKVTGGTHVMSKVLYARALYEIRKFKETEKAVTEILDDEPTNIYGRLLKAQLRASKEPGVAKAEMQAILKESPAFGGVRRALNKI